MILLSGYGTVDMAMEAIRAGAFDFLSKPLIDQELEMAIERVLSQRRVLEENQVLKKQLDLALRARKHHRPRSSNASRIRHD